MNKQEICRIIVGYLTDECGLSLASDEVQVPLFSSKKLSSLDILNLVSFLEETFGIKIGTWEVSLEGFDTVDLIAEFVLRKNA